jgi:OFA family oxalate/formate antiporter-like MFS transporter
VAGFGAGALITAPIASRLIVSVGVLKTFAILGIAYFLGVTIPAFFMKDPPAGFAPAGWQPSAAQTRERVARDYTLGAALGKWQWYALWAMLFLNTSAGISIISQAAPMAEEITHVSTALAAGMVGIISIANGSGRFLWAWLSDAIGRRAVFLAMFLVQAVVFCLMPHVAGFGLFTTLAFIVLLCYRGGFGTMPAFATDYFGATNVDSIYGLMLTAWGFAGVFGPMLIARIRQSTGHYAGALNVLAVVVLVSAVLPLITHPPKSETREEAMERPRAA